jgi:TRAP-type C4-dicarboxylate transport system substrate-binding protein
MSEAETATQIATLAENGMTVTEPSEELAAALAMAGEQMTTERLERAGDRGAAILEAYEAAQ